MATRYDVADLWLRAIGAPINALTRRAVAIWLTFESGNTITGNNPWNLHSGPNCNPTTRYCPGQGGLPGQIGNRYAGSGDRNVAVFSSLSAGIQANANNLVRLSGSGYGYDKVIAEIRSGDALGFLDALQKSSWSAGHYGFSKLVNAFRGGTNYNATIKFSSGTGGKSGPLPPPGDIIIDPINPPSPITNSDQLADFLGKKTTDLITVEDLEKIAGPNFKGIVRDQWIEKFVGKSVDFFAKQMPSNFKWPWDAISDAADDVGQAIEDFGQSFISTTYWLGILLIGLVIVFGAILLLGLGGKTEIDEK